MERPFIHRLVRTARLVGPVSSRLLLNCFQSLSPFAYNNLSVDCNAQALDWWCLCFVAWCRNGHILTHSTKKPFECKYKDCGKSYCDARSLKRHLEHHHALDGANSQTVVPPYDSSTYNQQMVSQSNPLTTSYPEQFSPVSSTSGSSNGASDKPHSAVAWPTTFTPVE